VLDLQTIMDLLIAHNAKIINIFISPIASQIVRLHLLNVKFYIY